MPNKTIYVSDDDMPLYQRAQELAGGNLSAAITRALRRFVDTEEGKNEGYEEITVQVGAAPGRKQRFLGVLLGEWGHSTETRVETYRVYRTRKGKFAVHIERSPDWSWKGEHGDGKTGPWGLPSLKDWRVYLGIGAQTWSSTAAEFNLIVVDTVEELREQIPEEFYEMIKRLAEEPLIEDLDI
jgi:EXLDI family protein